MSMELAADMRPAGADPERLSAYSGLLCEVFGVADKFSAPALAWRYGQNPHGAIVGFDAWSGERLVAHYATCPMAARVEGQMLRGLVSLNTATHPDAQGRGLFSRLAEAAYGAGADAGFDFVVGVANANSTPGFVRRLGFQLVAPLAAGWMARQPRRFHAAHVQFEGAWSAQTLAWRLANPAARYKAAPQADLLAVWARTPLPAVDCIALIAPPPGFEARDRPPLAASLFIGLDPRLPMGASRFVALPAWARPSPLNLIYRRLSARAPEQLAPEAVAFSFLDFDPY